MTNRMPLPPARSDGAQRAEVPQAPAPATTRGRVSPRCGRPCALRALPVLLLSLLLALGACSSAKPDAGAPPAGSAGGAPAAPAAPPQPGSDPVVDESFSIRLDENLYQLEEAVYLIAGSLRKVADRTPRLAINSFHFGKEVDSDFRRKAEVVILDKLFVVNPTVQLVQCQECQKLETKIQRGVLHLRKGIPSQEARRALAEKLSVDGFIDIGMFRSNGQLTVYLKVVEAKSGAIILVDELAGRRAPKRDALTFSFGELIFPINVSGTDVDHKALSLAVQESVKLTGRFSFAVDLVFYTDNNENNPETHLTLDGGLLLSPTLGFDILQVPSSTSRLILFVGIGKLISPQLDYANLTRAGLEMIVGDQLSVLFGFNNFLETQVEGTGTNTLKGSGYELRFGYRF